jgi:hypothetical protein
MIFFYKISSKSVVNKTEPELEPEFVPSAPEGNLIRLLAGSATLFLADV